MKNLQHHFHTLIHAGTARDLAFVGLIIIFVFNSLPVSIKGNENIAQYFFVAKNTQVIHSVANCLNPYQPCAVALSPDSRLSVSMPALVAITDNFDVSANVTGIEVERITVTFMGTDHSHGLLPQTMIETAPSQFYTQGKLSYCGYRNMDWLAMVTVYTKQTTYITSFSFKSIDTRIEATPIDQDSLTPYSRRVTNGA